MVLTGPACGSRNTVITGTFQGTRRGWGQSGGDPGAMCSVWGSKNCGLVAPSRFGWGVLDAAMQAAVPHTSLAQVYCCDGETALAAELGFPQTPPECNSGQALARPSAAVAASNTHRSSGLCLAGTDPLAAPFPAKPSAGVCVFPVLPHAAPFPCSHSLASPLLLMI